MASVYFLILCDPADSARDFGLVKVGFTDGDVADRIAQLQTGNPYELRCADTIETAYAREVEHFVHRTHAEKMQQLEWLRWPRDRIAQLVDETREAARRIDARKSREMGIVMHPSNGEERRPDREEFKLHRQAREVKKKLVPATLRLTVAAETLRGLTGTTRGIYGIVRVTRVPATTRFSATLAEARFPELVARCRVERISGNFLWRKVPRPSDFVDERLAAEEAIRRADESANAVLAEDVKLDGWTPHSDEIEKLHGDFLRETQGVNRLRADLADLQSELTIRLGEREALHDVCSFRRRFCADVDADAFCNAYPEEARLCMETVAAQLRKYIYPTRSYL
ncbi:GIY-YIG nuclease family protein [Sorangium sp. So ce269]